ncbi:hypothetical protein BC827DRAFT_1221779 [Russula dissimulans]|nr:hypothetical protein BC827DRAFT_1221779 [Russula dissimulans]
MVTCSIIHKLASKDVCQEDEGLIFRVIGLGSGDVCLDAVNLLVRSLRSGLQLGNRERFTVDRDKRIHLRVYLRGERR